MLNKTFKEALKVLNKKLKKNNIKWALIGTTNLALQGMNINPRDLDIVVTLGDLKKIPFIFEDYSPTDITKLPVTTDEPAWDVTLIILDVKVQIMGERDTGEYVNKLLANKIIQIKVDTFEVPCFTLEAEAQAYTETNRAQRAQTIRNFLKKQNEHMS